MSNLIKNGFVNLNLYEKRVLDNTEIEPEFESVAFPTIDSNEMVDITEKQTAEETEKVDLVEDEQTVRDINRLLKDRELEIENAEKELEQKAEIIINNANDEAKAILSEAKNMVDEIKQAAYEEGKQEGFDVGYKEGEVRLQELRKEWEIEFEQKNSEFEEQVNSFEKDFVDLASSLIENITGILVEDKKGVIAHLIERAFSDIEKSNVYTIRVSKEDFDIVKSQKQKLLDKLPEGVMIDISESDNMEKNKCLIETDNSVIDCSLDAQLMNLSTELKLLSRL